MKIHEPITDETGMARTLNWTFKSLILLMLGIIGWTGRELYSELLTQVEAVEQRLYRVELWQAKTSGDRFTARDWLQERSNIADAIASLDKRVSRNEETNQRILAELDKISRKLDRLMGYDGQ